MPARVTRKLRATVKKHQTVSPPVRTVVVVGPLDLLVHDHQRRRDVGHPLNAVAPHEIERKHRVLAGAQVFVKTRRQITTMKEKWRAPSGLCQHRVSLETIACHLFQAVARTELVDKSAHHERRSGLLRESELPGHLIRSVFIIVVEIGNPVAVRSSQTAISGRSGGVSPAFRDHHHAHVGQQRRQFSSGSHTVTRVIIINHDDLDRTMRLDQNARQRTCEQVMTTSRGNDNRNQRHGSRQ